MMLAAYDEQAQWLSLTLVFPLLTGLVRAEVALTVTAAQPVQNEPAYVRVQASGDDLNSSTFHEHLSYITELGGGPDFRLLTVGNGQPAIGDPVDFTFYLGRLPVGSYTVDISPSENPADAGFAEASFEVTLPSSVIGPGGQIRASNPGDYSGLWYNPQAPGTSVVLEQSPATRRLGGGIYLHEEDDQPVWFLLAPMDWTSASLKGYQFDVFRTRGSDHRGNYDPSDSGATKVDVAQVDFTDHRTMEITFVIDGLSHKATLERFGFLSRCDCHAPAMPAGRVFCNDLINAIT